MSRRADAGGTLRRKWGKKNIVGKHNQFSKPSSESGAIRTCAMINDDHKNGIKKFCSKLEKSTKGGMTSGTEKKAAGDSLREYAFHMNRPRPRPVGRCCLEMGDLLGELAELELKLISHTNRDTRTQLEEYLKGDLSTASTKKREYDHARKKFDSCKAKEASLKAKGRTQEDKSMAMAIADRKDSEAAYNTIQHETQALLTNTNAKSNVFVLERMCNLFDAYEEYFKDAQNALEKRREAMMAFRDSLATEWKQYAAQKANSRIALMQTGPVVAGSLFGSPIADIVGEDNEPPRLIRDAINYLVSSGALEEEGVFRISGMKANVEELKDRANAGETIDFIGGEVRDPNDVTGFLKLWLRDMPEPLLTYKLYSTFIGMASEGQDKIKLIELKATVECLPDPNYKTLKLIMGLMHATAELQATNKMGPANLATVLGPNVLYARSPDPLRMVQDMQVANAIIRTVIANYKFIFASKTPPVPPISAKPQTPPSVPKSSKPATRGQWSVREGDHKGGDSSPALLPRDRDGDTPSPRIVMGNRSAHLAISEELTAKLSAIKSPGGGRDKGQKSTSTVAPRKGSGGEMVSPKPFSAVLPKKASLGSGRVTMGAERGPAKLRDSAAGGGDAVGSNEEIAALQRSIDEISADIAAAGKGTDVESCQKVLDALNASASRLKDVGDSIQEVETSSPLSKELREKLAAVEKVLEARSKEASGDLESARVQAELLLVQQEEAAKEEARKIAEKERMEKERMEKERMEKERMEKERMEKERIEKERMEKERMEKERMEKERMEKERMEREASAMKKADEMEEKKDDSEKNVSGELKGKHLDGGVAEGASSVATAVRPRTSPLGEDDMRELLPKEGSLVLVGELVECVGRFVLAAHQPRYGEKELQVLNVGLKEVAQAVRNMFAIVKVYANTRDSSLRATILNQTMSIQEKTRAIIVAVKALNGDPSDASAIMTVSQTAHQLVAALSSLVWTCETDVLPSVSDVVKQVQDCAATTTKLLHIAFGKNRAEEASFDLHASSMESKCELLQHCIELKAPEIQNHAVQKDLASSCKAMKELVYRLIACCRSFMASGRVDKDAPEKLKGLAKDVAIQFRTLTAGINTAHHPEPLPEEDEVRAMEQACGQVMGLTEELFEDTMLDNERDLVASIRNLQSAMDVLRASFRTTSNGNLHEIACRIGDHVRRINDTVFPLQRALDDEAMVQNLSRYAAATRHYAMLLRLSVYARTAGVELKKDLPGLPACVHGLAAALVPLCKAFFLGSVFTTTPKV